MQGKGGGTRWDFKSFYDGKGPSFMGLYSKVDELPGPVVARHRFLNLATVQWGAHAVTVEIHFCAGTWGGIVSPLTVNDEGLEVWVGGCGCA